jgi:hypothetical protein
MRLPRSSGPPATDSGAARTPICRRGAALSQPPDEPGDEHGRREDAERDPTPLRAARLLVLVGRGGRSGCCRSRRAHAGGGRRSGRGGRWRRRNGGRLRLNRLCLRDGHRSRRNGLRNRRRGLRRRDRHGAWPGHGLRLGRRRLGRLGGGRGSRRRSGRDRARRSGRGRPRGRPCPDRRVIAAPAARGEREASERDQDPRRRELDRTRSPPSRRARFGRRVVFGCSLVAVRARPARWSAAARHECSPRSLGT